MKDKPDKTVEDFFRDADKVFSIADKMHKTFSNLKDDEPDFLYENESFRVYMGHLQVAIAAALSKAYSDGWGDKLIDDIF